MLILPPGHIDTIAFRWRLSTREKWMVGGVLAAVAALAIVIVISFASSGPASSNGCIYATVPAATGAEQIHQCGAAARETCTSVFSPGSFTPQAAQRIASECRKAGLPAG